VRGLLDRPVVAQLAQAVVQRAAEVAYSFDHALRRVDRLRRPGDGRRGRVHRGFGCVPGRDVVE